MQKYVFIDHTASWLSKCARNQIIHSLNISRKNFYFSCIFNDFYLETICISAFREWRVNFETTMEFYSEIKNSEQ